MTSGHFLVPFILTNKAYYFGNFYYHYFAPIRTVLSKFIDLFTLNFLMALAVTNSPIFALKNYTIYVD